MPFFLEFTHHIPGRTREEAYQVIATWLNDEKAQVKEASPPSRIVAAHGRALQPLGWRKDARKTLEFGLLSENGSVAIQVRITPATLNASDVRMRSDEARANWAELLAGLWMRFGEANAIAEAGRVAAVDWNDSLRRGWGGLVGGVLLISAGLALAVLFALTPPMYLGTGLVVSGVMILVYGAMTVSSARAHLAR